MPITFTTITDTPQRRVDRIERDDRVFELSTAQTGTPEFSRFETVLFEKDPRTGKDLGYSECLGLTLTGIRDYRHNDILSDLTHGCAIPAIRLYAQA